MKLALNDTAKKLIHTICNLCIDGERFRDTIEGEDCGLTSDMTEVEFSKIKVKCETAIPSERYDATLDVMSSKRSISSFYKQYTNDSNVSRLLNVPGFGGILVHTENSGSDSCGCALVGKNTVVGKLYQVRIPSRNIIPNCKQPPTKLR